MADTRILLVDDEKEVTALLAKRLVRRGYQCATAADGQQAVDAMREQPFPIVVMDVKMPNMDGIAALKVIVEQWPTAQVLRLSGLADLELGVLAMSDCAFGYMMNSCSKSKMPPCRAGWKGRKATWRDRIFA